MGRTTKIKQISKEEAREMGRKRRAEENKRKKARERAMTSNSNPYNPNPMQAEAMEAWAEGERAVALAYYLHALDGEGMEDVRHLRERAKKLRLAHEALWPEGKAPTLAMCARRFARPVEVVNIHLLSRSPKPRRGLAGSDHAPQVSGVVLASGASGAP
jgi:hypothetical protein